MIASDYEVVKENPPRCHKKLSGRALTVNIGGILMKSSDGHV